MSEPFVHPTAVVDDGVELADDVKIWHFCHVSAGARIGEGSILGQNVFVGPKVQIGSGAKVQNNVSVYAGVTLEEDVFVGPSVVFTNVLTPRAHVERKDEFLETKVGRGSTLGANATVVCGHSIGPFALVGAGSVVTADVTAHAVVVGNPARRTAWACRCGEVLPNNGVCGRCGDRYELTETTCKRVD